MKRSQILEVDFYDFKSQLKRAVNSGQRIEITDKQSWKEYVSKHKIPEAALAVHARSRSMSGKLQQVVIADNGPWDGYYIYSPEEEFCLKFEPGTG